MYRRPKFLEMLIGIRLEMAREVDYDVDLFVGRIRRENALANDKRLAEIHSAGELTDDQKNIPMIRHPGRKVRKT